MPRTMRVQHPGAIYHGLDRGVRRKGHLSDDMLRQELLKAQAEARQRTGWQVPAYGLMPSK